MSDARTNPAEATPPPGPPPTLAPAVLWLSDRLRSAGIETPEVDARRLVAAATGLPAHRLIAAPDTPLPPPVLARIAEFATRRTAREPVSRILGRREFWGRDFEVTPATLDPRPDTETIVEAALEVAAARGWRSHPIRILDIGTGTGCLLLSLLAELPDATGLGTDVSAEALAVARRNAAALGVAARACFALRRGLDGCEEAFDLVVSNPPYIPTADVPSLAPEVADFDPGLALDGGPDGLDVYRQLAPELGRVAPHGVVVLEVGAGQAADVAGIVTRASPALTALPPRRDLLGHDRCVIFAA